MNIETTEFEEGGHQESDELKLSAQEIAEHIAMVETKSSQKYVFTGSPQGILLRLLKDGRLMDEEGEPYKIGPTTYTTIDFPTACCWSCNHCSLKHFHKKMETADKPNADEEQQRFKKLTAMTRAHREEILEDMHTIGGEQLVIIGTGEPLMESPNYDDFKDTITPIVEKAADLGMGTTIFTTLANLNEDQMRQRAEFFRDHNVSLMISIHSMNDEQYKKILNSPKADIEQTKRNIETLVSVFNEVPVNLSEAEKEALGGRQLARVAFNFTINEINDNQAGIQEIMDFAHEHGIQVIVNDTMARGGAANDAVMDRIAGNQNTRMTRAERIKKLSDTEGQSTLYQDFCSFGQRGTFTSITGETGICSYENALRDEFPNALTLIRMPKEAKKEFWGMKNDRQAWEILQSTCVTRAEVERQHQFFNDLRSHYESWKTKWAVELAQATDSFEKELEQF